jgi:hypothetical protein
MSFGLQHDPGLNRTLRQHQQGSAQDEVRKILIETLEGVITSPPTAEEMDRSRLRCCAMSKNQMRRSAEILAWA